MNFNELEFKETETPKGIQALVQFGRYEPKEGQKCPSFFLIRI